MKEAIKVKVVIIINFATQTKHIIRVLQIAAERLIRPYLHRLQAVVHPVIILTATAADTV